MIQEYVTPGQVDYEVYDRRWADSRRAGYEAAHQLFRGIPKPIPNVQAYTNVSDLADRSGVIPYGPLIFGGFVEGLNQAERDVQEGVQL